MGAVRMKSPNCYSAVQDQLNLLNKIKKIPDDKWKSAWQKWPRFSRLLKLPKFTLQFIDMGKSQTFTKWDGLAYKTVTNL